MNEIVAWILEDNRTYKCVPGSGPCHYVGQRLTERPTGVIYECVIIKPTMSGWKIYQEN